jgi:hypothetical protein
MRLDPTIPAAPVIKIIFFTINDTYYLKLIFLSIIYIGLCLILGINLAKYSEIIPIEKKIAEETTNIKVIIKNWYLNTNRSKDVRIIYNEKTNVDNIKLIVDVIVIICSGFTL